MGFPLKEDDVALVSRADSEALMAAATAYATDPRGGIFGPNSIAWKINREAALFLGAGRAALLQLAHPWVATALKQHSTVLADPIARFHNTFRIVFTTIFGSTDQAIAAARHLYALHTRIGGRMDEDVAAYARGSRYEANEIGALRWVCATLIESAVIAYEAVLGPLPAREREAYYAEWKILAGLFGIPSVALPEDWSGFSAYCAQMAQSDLLGVSESARAMAQKILSGAGSWIHPPRWYRAMTAMWLPERFRDEFGLVLRDRDRRAAERALRRLIRIYRRLPAAIRFVGPWHEAQARLKQRRAGWIAGIGNRFWIGQARLPFGG
jgi:uncharacterized protein (DUF2236 family)